MRSRFISGMVAGTLLGATVGIYTRDRMSSRQKRIIMKNGNKLLKNASNLVDDLSLFKVLQR